MFAAQQRKLLETKDRRYTELAGQVERLRGLVEALTDGAVRLQGDFARWRADLEALHEGRAQEAAQTRQRTEELVAELGRTWLEMSRKFEEVHAEVSAFNAVVNQMDHKKLHGKLNEIKNMLI